MSAYLLQREGYDVVGVFLKVWEPDFLPCTAEADRLDAMRVAAHLQIPFLTYDFEDVYRRDVVEYFIQEYREGRTPNPDVLCNRSIKFGAFWERAKAEGANFIATGHYARVLDTRLFRGVDEGKDQSYFLWTLTADDLAHTLFPVGALNKSDVRKVAERSGLPNAAKRDSQGLCFLGHVAMKEFLQHYIPVKKGAVLDANGRSVGEHDGVYFYTIGQHLPVVGNKKMYVVSKDVEENTLTVSDQPDERARNTYELQGVNWVNPTVEPGVPLEAQIRYHGERLQANVVGGTVTFQQSVSVAAGQSVVFYYPDTGECVGGGIIDDNARYRKR